jgi:hypothetical protein
MQAKVRGSRPFCRYFCRYPEERAFASNSAIPNDGSERMAHENDGASGNSDTSTAAPSERKFDKGAWSSEKIFDVTDCGLYFWSRRTIAGPATLPPSGGGCGDSGFVARLVVFAVASENWIPRGAA